MMLRAISVGGLAAGAIVAAALAIFVPSSESAAPPGYAAAVLDDRPASYWRLDEVTGANANDARSRRTGAYRGSPTLGAPGALAGDPSTAVGFDGSDDAVRIPNAPAISTRKGVTIELWVRRSAGNRKQVLVAGRSGAGAGAGAFQGYMVWVDAANRVRATFGDTRRSVTVTSATPLDTEWHHVVAISAGGSSRLFVDGVRRDKTKGAIRPTQPTATRLGVGTTGRNRFAGSLDEVAIYRGALSRARVEAHYRAGRPGVTIIGGPTPPAPPKPPGPGGDTTSPVVAVSSPASGAVVTTGTPVISGTAGVAAGDLPSVTVRLYSGATATGTPIRTLNATRAGGGGWSVTTTPPLGNGTVTAQASQSDAAGNVGVSTPRTFSVATPPSPVFIGAGDIAGCGSELPGAQATANILAANPTATVFTLGDNAYDNGTLSEFNNCFGPTWGAHKSRIRPTVADHELDTGSPNGYLTYFNAQLAPFGATATDPTKMYYSYNLGAWHVVHLNAACFFYTPGCSVVGQENWFRDDLAANPTQCTAVLLHAPRFSSGNIHGNNTDMQNLWAIAYQGGVELVLSGDDHIYERFAPMDAAGIADPAFGVRQFISGTGGYLMYGIGTVKPNSQVRYTANFGVLKLTLHPTSYDFQFVPINGLPSPDSGSGVACHNRP